MSIIPEILRCCGFHSAAEVREAAKRNGHIVAPMKHDEEMSKLLQSWEVDEPIEY